AMRGFLDRRKLLGMSKKLSMKFLSGLLSSTWLYTNAGKAARTALRWLPRFAVYNPLNGWGRQRDLPDPPRQSFREQYATRQRESGDK
ncbi:MAG: lactate utilization protein LutB domain-containing protein, partial [Fuerstiella sp.]